MTQEEKNLLLKDLCSRLSYHIRVKVWLKDGTTEEGFFDFEHNYGDVMMDFFFYDKLKDLKPYLRPMSSMTEKERKEYDSLCEFYGIYECEHVIDFLNEHHFDYRGLIKMGLAIEAPENMYKHFGDMDVVVTSVEHKDKL